MYQSAVSSNGLNVYMATRIDLENTELSKIRRIEIYETLSFR